MGSRTRGPTSAKRGMPWYSSANASLSAGIACTQILVPISSMLGWKQAPVACSISWSYPLYYAPALPSDSDCGWAGMLYQVQFKGMGSPVALMVADANMASLWYFYSLYPLSSLKSTAFSSKIPESGKVVFTKLRSALAWSSIYAALVSSSKSTDA